MSHALKLMIRADVVCAYLWARADADTRATLCASARISNVPMLLQWTELGQVERIALMVAIVGEIENTVGHLRLEARQQHATEGAA